MRMVAQFSKGEDLKFCSHLDTQKIFIRALSRADIPVHFSQGFNKHPQISMALALPVGESSRCEYIDIAMESEMSGEEFTSRMNAALPEGLRIIRAKLLEGGKKSLTAAVFAADYQIKLKSFIELKKKIARLLQKDVIIIEKKTKSGVAPTDIRGLILSCQQNDEVISCCLRCGQVNLKAKDLMALLVEGEDFAVEKTAVYAQKDGELTQLFNIL